MKLNKNLHVERVCSTEKGRESLANPYLDGTHLVASNGRALIALEIERDAEDVDGWVPVEALKASRKMQKAWDEKTLHCNGTCKLADGTSYPRPLEGTTSRFPNWRQVIPEGGSFPQAHVAFDPRMLLDIAKALGSEEGVKLTFQTEDGRVMRVSPLFGPLKGSSVIAVIMAMSIR
jgi:hypothetical protein